MHMVVTRVGETCRVRLIPRLRIAPNEFASMPMTTITIPHIWLAGNWTGPKKTSTPARLNKTPSHCRLERFSLRSWIPSSATTGEVRFNNRLTEVEGSLSRPIYWAPWATPYKRIPKRTSFPQMEGFISRIAFRCAGWMENGIRMRNASIYRSPAKVSAGTSFNPILIRIQEVDQRNVTSKASKIALMREGGW